MKNLLVAVDLQDTDQVLLEYTADIALKFQSRLWLLHVAAPDPEFVGYEVGPIHIRDFLADEHRQDHRLIQSYADALLARGVAAEGLLIQGPTAEMIRAEVEKLSIDLLILGSHRHTFLYEVFVGNTAARVMKGISIPVLIIPLPDES